MMKRMLCLMLCTLVALGALPVYAEEPAPADSPSLIEEIYGDISDATVIEAVPMMAPMNAGLEATTDLAYMGLFFSASEELISQTEQNSVFVRTDAVLDPENDRLAQGMYEFVYVPQAERDKVPGQGDKALNDRDAFDAWYAALPRFGRISVFHKDVLATAPIEELTGYLINEEMGQNGEYTFYVSTESAGPEGAGDLQAAIDSLFASLRVETPLPIDSRFTWFTMPRMELPDTAGSFSTKDLNGNAVTEAVFENAELTMVNVWTTWCGPCIEELPHLGELSGEFAAAGDIQILGILRDALALDTGDVDPERVEMGQFICERTGASYPMLIPDEALLSGLLKDISAFPTTFFFDAEGNLVGDVVVGSRSKEEWRDILSEYLALVEAK